MHFTGKTWRCRIQTTLLITCVLALAFHASGQKFRYFGTNLSDWAVLTNPNGGGQFRWRVLKNESTPAGVFFDIPFGLSSDGVVNPGNWSGGAAHDLAVFRGGTYYTQEVGGGNTITNWGVAGDFAGSEGDYDGDGKMDYTIVRAPTPTSPLSWWVLRSSDSTARNFTFGSNATDLALPGADYTGDGIDDPAIARIGTGGQLTWWIGTTTGASVMVRTWGNYNVDFIVPGGDYDGDGKADFMVWRGLGDGVWYLMTNSGSTSFVAFGIPGGANRDRALRAGDYDGDGKTDIAIYRPSTMTFWVNRSSGGIQTQVWGDPAGVNTPVGAYGIF